MPRQTDKNTQRFNLPGGGYIVTPKSPRQQQMERRGRLASDAGVVSRYQTPDYQKSGKEGFIRRILGIFSKSNKSVKPEQTTERGSAGAASPSTYSFSLLSQRFERRQIIEDCNLMYRDDPRARRAVQMFAREAVNGFQISVIMPEDKSKEEDEEEDEPTQPAPQGGPQGQPMAPEMQAGMSGQDAVATGVAATAQNPGAGTTTPGANPAYTRAAKDKTGNGPKKVADLKDKIAEPSPEQAHAIRAQEVCDEVVDLIKGKIKSWGVMTIVEGDLFTQGVVSGKKLVKVIRMPAGSMERVTDDTDEFIDPMKAYAQVDTSTNEEVATFAEWQINHLRWNHIDGERYGESELIAVRRMRRLLEILEESQGIRRATRAAQKVLWNIGGEDNPGTQTEIENWKEENGFVEGVQDLFDPTNVARDYFGNGLVSASPIDSDSNLHEIDDLKYFQNVMCSTGLPTPMGLMNLDASAINRDVLRDQTEQWLKQTKSLSDMLQEVVRYWVDLALLLAGILPERVNYEVSFALSTTETPGEFVDTVQKLLNNADAAGNPKPMISYKRAIMLTAPISEIDDVEAEMQAIEDETDEMMQKQQQQQQAGAAGEAFGAQMGQAGFDPSTGAYGQQDPSMKAGGSPMGDSRKVETATMGLLRKRYNLWYNRTNGHSGNNGQKRN
jgi:hypothetical protein